MSAGVGGEARSRADHELVMFAAALACVAGTIHLAAAVDHFSEYLLYGVLFAIVAPLQLAWGTVVYRRPRERLLLAGAAGNLAVVVVWALSRTVGLPVGPGGAWHAEPVGLPDVLATADELLLAALVFALVRVATGAVAARADWLAALRRFAPPLAYVLLVASIVSLAVPHEHGGPHGH
jgi:hypothetical protein